MKSYSIELRTRENIKRYGFLSFGRNLSKKYGTQLLDAATKTGLDARVALKVAEATG